MPRKSKCQGRVSATGEESAMEEVSPRGRVSAKREEVPREKRAEQDEVSRGGGGRISYGRGNIT